MASQGRAYLPCAESLRHLDSGQCSLLAAPQEALAEAALDADKLCCQYMRVRRLNVRHLCYIEHTRHLLVHEPSRRPRSMLTSCAVST